MIDINMGCFSSKPRRRLWTDDSPFMDGLIGTTGGDHFAQRPAVDLSVGVERERLDLFVTTRNHVVGNPLPKPSRDLRRVQGGALMAGDEPNISIVDLPGA
ncbi:hypothetical protein [Stackebrandtia soli]|uniref:hypothetical protein n=1 Tax=Stackebrandtia soli TaxID=1892856 RepID=UPI0039EAE41A